MSDKWVAECTPCTWVTFHDTQDAAIEAASAHVDDAHRQTPTAVRTANRMGHVQFRTVTAEEWSLEGEWKPLPDPPKPPPDLSEIIPQPKDANSDQGEYFQLGPRPGDEQE